MITAILIGIGITALICLILEWYTSRERNVILALLIIVLTVLVLLGVIALVIAVMSGGK